MKFVKNLDQFLNEKEEGSYIKYAADIQFRIIATTLTDVDEIKKLPLSAEKFVGSDVAKETTEHSVTLKTQTGAFGLKGAKHSVQNVNSLKDSATIKADGKDFASIFWTSNDDIPSDDGFNIQVVKAPTDFKHENKDLKLRFATVKSSYKPGKEGSKSHVVAMSTRAKNDARNNDGFKEFGYSYTKELENNSNISLSGDSNVVYLIYSPISPKVPTPKFEPVKFNDSFVANSIDINKDENFKKTVDKLMFQIGRMKEAGGKYTLSVDGFSSQVPTSYEGGNQKLAEDRAKAMLKTVNETLLKNKISLKDILSTQPKITGDVIGEAWDKTRGLDYYKQWQRVELKFSK